MNPNLIAKTLEIGAGCGIISLFIAANWTSRTVATDISPIAVEATIANARLNNLTLTAFQSDLFEKIDEKDFDLIIFNTPMVDKNPENDIERFSLCDPHGRITEVLPAPGAPPCVEGRADHFFDLQQFRLRGAWTGSTSTIRSSASNWPIAASGGRSSGRGTDRRGSPLFGANAVRLETGRRGVSGRNRRNADSQSIGGGRASALKSWPGGCARDRNLTRGARLRATGADRKRMMSDANSSPSDGVAEPKRSRYGSACWLRRPYFAIVIIGVVGVCWTSLFRTPDGDLLGHYDPNDLASVHCRWLAPLAARSGADSRWLRSSSANGRPFSSPCI